MRKVIWAPEALDDLSEQLSYVAERNPANARLVADRVKAAAVGLGEFATGHIGRRDGTFEKVVLRTSLIIAYEMNDQKINIVRVIHGARNWTAEKWPQD
jgi:toxin ParE1/3/4